MHSFNIFLLSTRKFYWFRGYNDEREISPSFIEFISHFDIELSS